MLDALPVELHQELFDLAGALGGLLVQRDADHAIRGAHGLGGQAGVFTLDVEVTRFTEVEQFLVEVGPVDHAPAIDVMGQVVDNLEAGAHRVAVDAFEEHEVDVIDRTALTETVDQIQRRAADALDRRQVQFHRPGFNVNRLGAQLQRTVIGLLRVFDPERHAAHRRAVLGRKVRREAVGLVVEDQVDLALAEQVDVLGAVGGDFGKAHDLEDRLQGARGWRCEFDKFKAHQAHWVFVLVGHFRRLILVVNTQIVSCEQG